jgi:hypothetical protein
MFVAGAFMVLSGCFLSATSAARSRDAAIDPAGLATGCQGKSAEDAGLEPGADFAGAEGALEFIDSSKISSAASAAGVGSFSTSKALPASTVVFATAVIE